MDLKASIQVREIDFATLTDESLWSIFVTKSLYGGALAYAVLSRANKMGCVCSVSLQKSQEKRTKQFQDWREWCSLACNLLWARLISFQVVSQRESYKGRILATWSKHVALPLPVTACSEFTLSDDCVARIASLAVHGDSAKLLDQVVFCAHDDRRIIMSELWFKIMCDFVCNASFEVTSEFAFSQVQHIRQAVHLDFLEIPLESIAATWLRIVFHLQKLFSSSSLSQSCRRSENETVWTHYICCPSFLIPMRERAIIMWIWLLWSSKPLPFFLSAQLRSAIVASSDAPCLADKPVRTAQDRLSELVNLRFKRLITKSEYETKRQCILSSL